MPLVDFREQSSPELASATTRTLNSSTRTIASHSKGRRRYLHRSNTTTQIQENKRVVRKVTICAGNLRVRSCKLLWKPVALQLLDTTTSSLHEDEAYLDNCDDDSDDSDNSDINKLTTMAQPNETHHYSLVFWVRSLMGHARRYQIELNAPRDPVEVKWGEEELLRTRFEFTLFYGSSGPTRRRRTLIIRARDATEYLLWTRALCMATRYKGRNNDVQDVKINRFAHRSLLSTSKARFHSRKLLSSLFRIDYGENQWEILENEARKELARAVPAPVLTPVSESVTSAEGDIAEESALKPVPAEIAAEYGVDRRRGQMVTSHPIHSYLQRQKQSVASASESHLLTKVSSQRSMIYRISENASLLAPSNAAHSAKNAYSQAHLQDKTGTPPISVELICSAVRSTQSRLEETCRQDLWEPHTPTSNCVSGALPVMEAPSEFTESPLDFVDWYTDTACTARYAVPCDRIESARQRQKLLRRKEPKRLEDLISLEDQWRTSRASSRLNFDTGDFDDTHSPRTYQHDAIKKVRAEHPKIMECEL